MCICINCKWVDRCITYHDVENNHGVDHICDVPDFKAKKPFIHVNIVQDMNGDYKAKKPFIHVSLVRDKNGDYKTDWDVQSCESFANEFGKWSKFNPGMELPV